MAYLRIKTEMGHEVWVLESVMMMNKNKKKKEKKKKMMMMMMMMMMIRWYDDEYFGGDLFNEAFGSSYGKEPNYGRISEKLTENNVEGSGRGLN